MPGAPARKPNIAAAVSVAIAAITYFVASLAWTGTFSHGRCGDFGMQCIGLSFILLGSGCVAGFISALFGFRHAGAWRRVIVWIGVLANGIPLLLVLYGLAMVLLMRH
ncbi:hypothetical protein [Pseudoduganella lurida]|uniref:hypothetical protein n=1 Tax=Pseudoduganella lurida TaxID=1036180 RepID=UPI0011A92FB2|nr:hypothetical protein [Pseudoduganella lurida]